MSGFEIESYSFGRIQINGKIFTADLIITPEKIIADWWRKSGHSLCMEDLKDVMDAPPDVLIVGCGAHGVLKVPADTLSELERRGIEVITETTGKAVGTYTRLRGGKQRVAAGLHLTC